MTHNDKKYRTFVANSKMILMIELVDKNIKRIVIIVFHIFKKLVEIYTVIAEIWKI